MFILAVLSAIAVATAAPAPGYLHGAAPVSLDYAAPLVGHSTVIGSVPTSITSSSSSIVHSSAILQPTIHSVAAAPTLAALAAAPATLSAGHGLLNAAPLTLGGHDIEAAGLNLGGHALGINTAALHLGVHGGILGHY